MESTGEKGVIYEFEGFVLDPDERTLTVDGIPLHLPEKEFVTLLYLVQNSGRALTKEEMMSAIWQDAFVEEVNLAKQISRLRKVLNNDQNELIQTIPKHGYRFKVSDLRRREPDLLEPVIVEKRTVNRMRVAYDTADDLLPIASRVSSAEYVFSVLLRHKRLALTGLVALAILIASAGFFFFNRAPALTEKDDILLADFENATGDAVFDGTLNQALAIQLEQSPFLNIFSEQRVREALRFMNRSPDERVTKDIAREICERQGLKAYLLGSISSLGSNFVINLEAVNTQTGDVIARQQVEAESKEQVISALGGAATKLREKLGESLTSIEKYDAPIHEVTTSSLEALKAYSMGSELNAKVKMDEAIPFYKRAVELDPNFAFAYASLSGLYILTGQRELGNLAEQKAFDLRGRVSERERLEIVANHYKWRGEMEQSIEANRLLTRIYPRSWSYWNDLGYNYLESGGAEKSIEMFREAIRLYPNAYPFWGLGLALHRLNHVDEAKEAFEQGLTHDDHVFFHSGLYVVAFVKQDIGALQQQVDWASARPEQFHLIWQGNAAAFSGQLRKARELYNRGIEIEQLHNKQGSNKQLAAGDTATMAFREAVAGNCQHVKKDTARSRAIMPDDDAKWRSAIALALCGETRQAQSLIDDIARRDLNENDAVWVTKWLPLARAAIELRRNNPRRTIEHLESASGFIGLGVDHQAPVVLLLTEYLYGLAYLNQNDGEKAAAEFQKILDNRGMVPIGIQYPLAHLGLARAAALTGDTAKSRKAYEDFFALWKDADPDIPVLLEARKEYERLSKG